MARACAVNQKCTQETRAQFTIDKWLWAARFFKTRSLAAAAVAGGKVALNGARPKPSRTIRAGDHLNIRRALTNGPLLSTEPLFTDARLRTLKHSTKKPNKADQEGKPPRPSLNLSGQPLIAKGGLRKRIGARYPGSPTADGDLRYINLE